MAVRCALARSMAPTHGLLLLFVAGHGGAAPTPRAVTLNNGLSMPLAAFGTWHYNDSWAKSGVVLAVEAGFRSIDTANDYFNQLGTGEGIGAAISAGGATREQLWVTSKVEGCGVPHPPHGTPVRAGHCHNDTLSVFEANLQLLKLPSVDLMLVHKPPPGGCGPENCASMQQQWAAFETMLAAGKARTIGVSNYCISCLECLAKTWKIVPAVNQIQLHVGMGADPEGLVSYCRARHIQIQAYSPLDVDQSNGTAELITGPLTNGIGRAHNKSGATVALKWLAQQAIPLVTKAHTMVHEPPHLRRAAVGSPFYLFSGDHMCHGMQYCINGSKKDVSCFGFLHAGVSGAGRRSFWVGAQRGGDAKARGRDSSGWHAEHDVHLQVVQMQIDWLAGWLVLMQALVQ